METFADDDDGLRADLYAYLGCEESPMQVIDQLAGTLPSNRASANRRREKRERDADKVKVLQALLASKAEQLAKLTEHNANLKIKNRILSEAVLLRDYQVHLTKGGTQVPARWFVQSSAPGSTQGTMQVSTFSGSVAQLINQPGSVRLLRGRDLFPPVDHARFRSVSRLQLVARWREFLSEISLALLQLEFHPEDELAAIQLQRIVGEMGNTYCHASTLAPDAMMGFMQTHMENESLSAPEPGYWVTLLQNLQLTMEQMQDLGAMYDLFSKFMRGILQERKEITARLSDGLQKDMRAPIVHLTVPPEGEILPALERNMRKERVAHLLMRGFVFGRTLSIVQMGRAAVHSYPFFPCATGLAAAASGVLA